MFMARRWYGLAMFVRPPRSHGPLNLTLGSTRRSLSSFLSSLWLEMTAPDTCFPRLQRTASSSSTFRNRSCSESVETRCMKMDTVRAGEMFHVLYGRLLPLWMGFGGGARVCSKLLANHRGVDNPTVAGRLRHRPTPSQSESLRSDHHTKASTFERDCFDY